MRAFAPVVLMWAVGACATGSFDCANLREGACSGNFTRFLTDTSATLTGPGGFGFTYGSNPNANATAQALSAINLLAARLPLSPSPVDAQPTQPVRPPQVPAQPPTDPEDAPDFEPMSLRELPRSCPAGPAWALRRVAL